VPSLLMSVGVSGPDDGVMVVQCRWCSQCRGVVVPVVRVSRARVGGGCGSMGLLEPLFPLVVMGERAWRYQTSVAFDDAPSRWWARSGERRWVWFVGGG
jgi:hypothetical protein